MIPEIREGWKPYEPKTKRGLPEICTMPLAVTVLTICSCLFDYSRYLNTDFLFTTRYVFTILMYIYGWMVILWCGRGVTFLFLVLNFLIFTVILSGYFSVSYQNVFSVLKNLPQYISLDVVQHRLFWIGGAVTIGEMILILPHSHFNLVKSVLILGSTIGLILFSLVFNFPTKYLYYPLWPGMYDTFHSTELHQMKQKLLYE